MWCFVYDFIASQASLLRVLEEPDLENILLESLGGVETLAMMIGLRSEML